ncbi:hypothetical protein HHI36_003636 [Cryptolaemus montrouzieri]|uniref:Uncharacterized protein n=1 Tax=Cryptolaemus montrouzieri TaxID=559131 RepID=A0ABD2PDX8_9CUCU
MLDDHHGYGTRNAITISYPLHRSALYEESPKYVASNVYYRLPKNLRQIDDPKSLLSDTEFLPPISKSYLLVIAACLRAFAKTQDQHWKEVQVPDNISLGDLPSCSYWTQNEMRRNGTQTENVIVHEDESTSSDEEQPEQDFNGSWSEPKGNHQVFEYNAEAGLSPNYAVVVSYDLSAYSCFRAFIYENIMRDMVDQTNLYANYY